MARFFDVARKAWRFLEQGRLGRGTASGIGAKLGGSLVQLVAIPIVIRAIGTEGFGVFVMVLGLTSWISIANSGFGYAVTSDFARHDPLAGPPPSLTIAVAVAGSQAILLALAVAAAVRYFGVIGALHIQDPVLRSQTWDAIVIVLMCTAIQMALQPIEAAQLGMLRTPKTNAFRAMGHVVAICSMLAASHFQLDLPRIALIIAGAPTLAVVANTAFTLATEPALFAVNGTSGIGPLIRRLVAGGVPFILISAASYALISGTELFVGWLLGPQNLVPFALFNRVLVFVLSGVGLITTPLWPAITQAEARGDLDWIRKIIFLLGAVLLLAMVVLDIVMSWKGDEILRLWSHRDLAFPPGMKVYFGLYYLVMVWVHFWGIVMIGLRRSALVAAVHTVEMVVIFSLAALLIPHLGSLGMVIAMVCVLALGSAWVFPIAAVRALRTRENRFHQTGAAGP